MVGSRELESAAEVLGPLEERGLLDLEEKDGTAVRVGLRMVAGVGSKAFGRLRLRLSSLLGTNVLVKGSGGSTSGALDSDFTVGGSGRLIGGKRFRLFSAIFVRFGADALD
jgi:hypothetical protein